LLTDHLHPGCPVYDEVAAEYPGVLSVFTAYISANQAWQMTGDLATECRSAADEAPRDEQRKYLWRDAAALVTTSGTAANDLRMFLAAQLRAAGHQGDAYAWIQTRLRALELEAEEASGDRAA
jgi:hypothetical protein